MTPLELAQSSAWDLFGGGETLLPDLALDAVLARAKTTGVEAVAARLLDLLVEGDGGDPLWEIADVFEEAGWRQWPVAQRHAVEMVLDAWWQTTLVFFPAAQPVEVVLASLAHFGVSLTRWLEPWLADLDGPPVQHLAELITGTLQSQGWVDALDERGQIIAWAQSEPVVIGITFVGGVHLDDGQLAEVLELLL